MRSTGHVISCRFCGRSRPVEAQRRLGMTGLHMAQPLGAQRCLASGGDGRAPAFQVRPSCRRAASRGQLVPQAAAPADSPAGGDGAKQPRSFSSASEKQRSVKGPGFRGGALATAPAAFASCDLRRNLRKCALTDTRAFKTAGCQRAACVR